MQHHYLFLEIAINGKVWELILQGVWVIRPPALISGPRARAPQKFSTSSTFSYLKSSHYDHVHITFNGLWVI